MSKVLETSSTMVLPTLHWCDKSTNFAVCWNFTLPFKWYSGRIINAEMQKNSVM